MRSTKIFNWLRTLSEQQGQDQLRKRVLTCLDYNMPTGPARPLLRGCLRSRSMVPPFLCDPIPFRRPPLTSRVRLAKGGTSAGHQAHAHAAPCRSVELQRVGHRLSCRTGTLALQSPSRNPLLMCFLPFRVASCRIRTDRSPTKPSACWTKPAITSNAWYVALLSIPIRFALRALNL